MAGALSDGHMEVVGTGTVLGVPRIRLAEDLFQPLEPPVVVIGRGLEFGLQGGHCSIGVPNLSLDGVDPTRYLTLQLAHAGHHLC